MRARLSLTAAGLAAALATITLAEKTMAQASHPNPGHPYVGMWTTDDNRIRHELLPGGRYVEARGTREGAYRGRYEVTGNRILYWDDTGFTADGEFVDADTLHHAGMILRRRERPSANAVP